MTKHEHSRGLVTIGIFKLLKAVFFFAMGVGALHFINGDLYQSITQAVIALKFDPESHFVSVLLEKADMMDDHVLRMLSVATLSYSAVATTEGIGLLMEQTWAEYLTLIMGIAFLPWEGFEILRHGSLWRVGVMLINIAIVAYLLWFVRQLREQKRSRHS